MSTPQTPPPQIGQNISGALDEVVKGVKSMGSSLKGMGGGMSGGIEAAGRSVEAAAAAPLRWGGKFMQNHPIVSWALVAFGVFKLVSSYMEKREAKKNGATLESAHGNELPGVYDEDPNFGIERPKYSLKEQPAQSSLAEREMRRREQPPSQEAHR